MLPAGVTVKGALQPGFEQILTTEALAFVADLHRRFNETRKRLLALRAERQKRFDAGETPDFLAETKHIREGDWKVAPIPRALLLVGQTLASLTITTLNSAGMLFLAWLVFGFRASGSLLAAALTLAPMLVALYGFGFAFAALVLLLRDANTLVDVSNFVVSTLSGSQFPVQVLPRLLLPLALALPLTYGFDAVRALLLGATPLLGVGYEIAILLAFMAVMAPLGYMVFLRVERRVRTLGTLGQH